jgi:hypothetical protein
MTTPSYKKVSRKRYEHIARYVAVNAGRIFSLMLYKELMRDYGNKTHLKGISSARKRQERI